MRVHRTASEEATLHTVGLTAGYRAVTLRVPQPSAACLAARGLRPVRHRTESSPVQNNDSLMSAHLSESTTTLTLWW